MPPSARNVRPRFAGALTAVGPVLILLIAGALAAVHAEPSAAAHAQRSAGSAPSDPHARVDRFAPTPDGPSATPAVSASPACDALRARFATLYPGPLLPPSVAAGLQGSCPIAYDEAGLGLLSNATSSGSRTSLTLVLPAAGSGATRALSAFEVGLWVAGVPCSAGGASYLTVALLPPSADPASPNGSNWTLRSAVYDLVPAGSCDPSCENQTALFSLTGSARSFCEDRAVVRGPVAADVPLDSFAPGSRLALTLVGAANVSTALAVYVNDSTVPANRLAWNYSAATTVSALPLTPLQNASSGGSGAFWGPGPSLSLRAVLCPSAAPGIGPGSAGCDAYDGPRLNASLLPRLTSALSWNASSGGYDVPYPHASAFSTSGGCAATGPVAPCVGFATDGGTGAYPYYSLRSDSGAAAWTFGGSDPLTASTLGGAAEFPSSGASSDPIPALAVQPVRVATTATALLASAHVSAPAGIGSVRLSVYFCSSQSSPTVTTSTAVELPGPENTSTDGNFTGGASFSHSEQGFAYYWWTVDSPAGGEVRSAPRSVAVGPGSRTCAYPLPTAPFLSASNVSAIGGGYRFQFQENDSSVTNFTATLTPASGGPSIVRPLSGTGWQELFLGAPGEAWNLSIRSFDAAGHLSNASATVSGAATLVPLSAATADSVSGDLWIGAGPVAINLSASGGVAPYTFSVAFGDGGSATATRASPYWNLTHGFGSFEGVAWVTASVVDAAGVARAAAPTGISILAGPLGVPQSLSAGSFDVRLDWSAPISPAAPVTLYTVYYTNRSASAATLTGSGPSNATVPGVHVWNTTATRFDVADADSGTTYYFLVVAWNAYGIGLLPEGWRMAPSATTANLSVTPLEIGPVGGPAPLALQVTDQVSLGTNGTLTQALYTFGNEGSVAANLSSNLSGRVAYWWLNASWTFAAAGEQLVELHVTDSYGDTQIPVGLVYVGPAAAPSALARVTSGTAIAGEPVSFEGIAGGGTGSYAFNWSFGDGGTSSDLSPAHTYFAPGNYTAVLVVTDRGDGVTAFAMANLTVFALPTVDIAVNATDPSGSAYSFRALVTGGIGSLLYSWSFGDGTTGTGPRADHTFGESGRFPVTLTVTDALHHTATATVQVVVPSPSNGPNPEGSSLTGPELAAYALLGTLAVILFIGLVYFWSKSRDDRDRPEPPARSERFPTRPPPPGNPPDPS